MLSTAPPSSWIHVASGLCQHNHVHLTRCQLVYCGNHEEIVVCVCVCVCVVKIYPSVRLNTRGHSIKTECNYGMSLDWVLYTLVRFATSSASRYRDGQIEEVRSSKGIIYLKVFPRSKSILRSLVAMTGPCHYDLVRTRPGFNSRRGSFFLFYL